MMQRLLLLGLNHTTAPIGVREQLVFSPEEATHALRTLKERYAGIEAALLSTCNRTELYIARELHGHPRAEEMASFLADMRKIPRESFAPYLYEKSEKDVVTHLFSVATSLDSMVLGETQILGQVRIAYDLAMQSQTAGPMLNPLFQRALAVGKQVMHETSLAEGHVSVASVAVDFARRIFDRFSDKTVLCIGAGKMAQLVLKSFMSSKLGRLVVCNRDPSRADDLARRCGGEAIPFDRLNEQLTIADIVVSSTGSTTPIITRAGFEPLLRARRYRPIFLMDIALPRDIDSAVGELENVYLYNLDDLQKVTAQTHAARRETIDAARQIVRAAVEQYAAWNRGREMGRSLTSFTSGITNWPAKSFSGRSRSCPTSGRPSASIWKS
jgi:glutamyl-tRNA reductase